MKQSSYSIVRLLIYRNNVESIEAEFGFLFTFNRKLCSYRLAEKKRKHPVYYFVSRGCEHMMLDYAQRFVVADNESKTNASSKRIKRCTNKRGQVHRWVRDVIG